MMTTDPAMLGAPTYDRNPGDRYFTESWVTQALVYHMEFRGVIWEPACGRGDMAKVLLNADYSVISSDIIGNTLGWEPAREMNFLTTTDFDSTADCLSIVTNPPYTLAENFIRHALNLTKKSSGMVAMLLRNEYDCAASRRDLFEHPAFRGKLVLTKRPRWIDTGHTASPRHNFAWYIWDHQHTGPAQIAWIP